MGQVNVCAELKNAGITNLNETSLYLVRMDCFYRFSPSFSA